MPYPWTAGDRLDAVELNSAIDESRVDVQTFAGDGTWTKPTGLANGGRVLVQLWGAGGSGGSNIGTGHATGGGGGMYLETWLNANDLGATETITIGVGGTSVTGSDSGNAGTASTFGSFASASGGSGGSEGNSGAVAGGAGGSPSGVGTQAGVWGIATSVNPAPSGLYSGGGGGVTSSPSVITAGGSLYGGAGGGSVINAAAGSGGVSIYGGNGGAANGSGDATIGAIPGGGGGGAANNNNSGAGAVGQCVVTSFPAP